MAKRPNTDYTTESKQTAPVEQAPKAAPAEPAATQEPQIVEEAPVQEIPVQEPPKVVAAVTDINTQYMEKGDIGIPISEQLQLMIGKVASTYGDVSKIPLLELAEFCKVMLPPKQVPLEQGVQQQHKLWTILQGVLNVQGPMYNAIVTNVLGLIHEYSSSVFDDLYIFRFQDQLHLNNVQRKAFRLVVVMLKEVCDPVTRFTNAKNVRPSKAMEGVFQEHAISQMLKYLQLSK